jgi:hypothetical protein
MTNLATMLHATGGAFPIMELKNDNNSRSPWTTAGHGLLTARQPWVSSRGLCLQE